MSSDCVDVCDDVISRLKHLGFEIDDEESDHSDILKALGEVEFVKSSDGSTLRQLIREFGEGQVDSERMDAFIEHCEKDLGQWLADCFDSFNDRENTSSEPLDCLCTSCG